VPETPVVADFDATRLSQALTNVLQNAIHASAEGGGVSLDVQAGDGVATIAISDSGPGFSPLALEKFAEPFFSEKEGGMGLGLTVASELCAAHGGSLQVENRAEQGAVVTLKLPTLQH
jgi:signal transduction histidine kinase